MKKIYKIAIVIISLILLNFIASKLFHRFDITKDKRYTLSSNAKDQLNQLDEIAFINVYLEGEFPSEFKRLQTETKQLLEELQAINSKIEFKFIEPLDQVQNLVDQGLEPSRLSVQENGKVSEAVIFPWATLSYKDNIENISLLSNQTTGGQEEQLERSIEGLEFGFINAIHKVTNTKEQKIAVLKGNGELDDLYLGSFLSELNKYYRLAPFTLDSVSESPEKTLAQLSTFDLAIIAKPNERFSEEEKFTLDQFICNGGKTMWLIDNVTAELDSLMQSGKSLAFNKDLNLTDLLFNYGVRVNYDLIHDIYSSTIRLAAGNVGDQTQFQDFLWHYYPVIPASDNHPITKNIDPVSLRFANTIDTLKNNLSKTILLESSQFSKPVGTPREIDLEEVSKKPVQEDYNNGNKILGVLIEGEFKSAYANRLKPFITAQYQEQSKINQMIVVADGDIIANQVYQGQPLELGLDKWTNIKYGNAAFLMNSVQYMLDDQGLLELRSKSLNINFLDKEKAFKDRTYWQLLNVIFPLIILILFGLFFRFYRQRKYC